MLRWGDKFLDIRKISRLGLLTALALIIFIVELRLPDIAPIAGMKLGLANIITVYAVYTYGGAEAALILYARILLGTLMTGNFSALIFSLSGGTLCLIGMILLKKAIDIKHMWLCSVFGAILHNIGQTAAAVAVMRTLAVISYLPFLMISGCIAGAFTGIAAQLIVSRINKYGKK